MSLKISKAFNGVTDPDAGAYIAAVEAADGQLLEFAVGKAINDFVVGCKADGIWNAIKASCILAGARTLNGALVPLVGAAPSNSGFLSADYNRKSLLSSSNPYKTVFTNRAGNADPRDSHHLSCWVVSAPDTSNGTFPTYIGHGVGVATGISDIGRRDGNGALYLRCRHGSDDTPSVSGSQTGFMCINRSSASQFSFRAASSTQTFNRPSETPPVTQFRAVTQGNGLRMSFYSIGTSLNFTALETRVTTLINTITAAIP